MHQVLFHVPGLGLPIYSYGVMMVVGFLLALELAKFLSKHVGFDPEVFINAGMIALVAGVVGARLSHVLENIHQYTDPNRSFFANFWDAVNIRSGGLTFYGGLLLAFPACIAYGIMKRVPIKRGMDIIAPCVMIGLAFGRIGCLLNGCCYGAECRANFPGAVTYPYYSNAYIDQYAAGEITPPDELTRPSLRPGGKPILLDPAGPEFKADATLAPIAAKERSLPVHNAQIYSTISALLIAAVCVAYFTMNPAPGRVMALMLMLEGVTRFILEILRSEPPVGRVFGYEWSLSMFLGVIISVAGVVMWLVCRRSPESESEPPASQRAFDVGLSAAAASSNSAR
jgi:phosphatidylglycerol:prolipoprotein diacylglycerol transferase